MQYYGLNAKSEKEKKKKTKKAQQIIQERPSWELTLPRTWSKSQCLY